jgi:hypothetical protein
MGIRTPAAIVREIKEHLGLCKRTRKGQAAIDQDDSARDERKQRWGYESSTDD